MEGQGYPGNSNCKFQEEQGRFRVKKYNEGFRPPVPPEPLYHKKKKVNRGLLAVNRNERG